MSEAPLQQSLQCFKFIFVEKRDFRVPGRLLGASSWLVPLTALKLKQHATRPGRPAGEANLRTCVRVQLLKLHPSRDMCSLMDLLTICAAPGVCCCSWPSCCGGTHGLYDQLLLGEALADPQALVGVLGASRWANELLQLRRFRWLHTTALRTTRAPARAGDPSRASGKHLQPSTSRLFCSSMTCPSFVESAVCSCSSWSNLASYSAFAASFFACASASSPSSCLMRAAVS